MKKTDNMANRALARTQHFRQFGLKEVDEKSNCLKTSQTLKKKLMNNHISTRKLKILFMLRESENGIRPIARLLRISRNTTKKYLGDTRAFCAQESGVNRTFPDYLNKVKDNGKRPGSYCQLFEIFPEVIKRIEAQERMLSNLHQGTYSSHLQIIYPLTEMRSLLN